MTDSKIQSTIEAALEAGRIVIPYGDVATYIPELAKADKNALGIAVRTKDGTLYSAGDCATRFTLQSISKIISLIVALERFGSDRVFERVGMEPSGEAFNSIVELDLYSGKPYNPMINSGAIAVADLLLETASFGEMLAIARELTGDPDASLDEAV
ncbi:MAG: glutaminase, partial [Clostridia bacterium]|nr:glutaminase [Clostridia bacterium]